MLWASENGKLSIVERLILADPTLIHVEDKDGYTPLHRACYNDHVHVVDVSTCFIYGYLGSGSVYHHFKGTLTHSQIATWHSNPEDHHLSQY
jgi:hypothetical protein